MSTITCRRLCSLNARFKEILTLSCRNFNEHAPKNKWDVVPKAEVKRFIIDSMKSVGTNEAHSSSLANNLAMADYRGHYSHGLNRLGKI